MSHMPVAMTLWIKISVLAPLRDLAPELVSERDLQLADGTVKQVDPL